VSDHHWYSLVLVEVRACRQLTVGLLPVRRLHRYRWSVDLSSTSADVLASMPVFDGATSVFWQRSLEWCSRHYVDGKNGSRRLLFIRSCNWPWEDTSLTRTMVAAVIGTLDFFLSQTSLVNKGVVRIVFRCYCIRFDYVISDATWIYFNTHKSEFVPQDVIYVIYLMKIGRKWTTEVFCL